MMSVNNAKKPLILKRMLIKAQATTMNKIPTKPGHNINSKLIKLSTIPLVREDVIFESKGESFLPGEYQSITIINKLNNFTNNCKTVARCVTLDMDIIEKTSDNITHLIGQEAYNTLFYALCSVINQEYKVKAILSVLTKKESTETLKSHNLNTKTERMGADKSCQTNETRLEVTKKRPRRVRKVLVPYVVKPEEPKLKKVTIDPFKVCNVKRDQKNTEFDVPIESLSELQLKVFKTESVEATDNSETRTSSSESVKSDLPDLGYLHDDNSNDSLKSFSTLHSFKTLSDLLINPISLVKNVDKHTKDSKEVVNDPIVVANHSITLMDETVVKVPFKPEDNFHIATKENLLFLDNINRKKLLLHQMHIDCEYCMSSIDEDGNLPIHLAVINNDLELLKRQCVVLKIRKQHVDVPARNGLTALKLSLYHETVDATYILLQHGADPFLDDEEHSTCVHLAAERKTEHLSVILNYCKLNARSIILNHAEELQTPGWENRSDEELGSRVLHHLCTLFDKPGYTPLMLASKLGHYENVRLIVESVPRCVPLAMPTCGNTALYLAVAAACTLSAERGNKSKIVDHFRKTIEILLEAGADPCVDNHCGSNVTLLLQEFNCGELSMLVANKLTYIKYFNGDEDYTKNFDKYILMKEGNVVSIKEMNSKKNDDKPSINDKVHKEQVEHKMADKKNVTKEAGNNYVTVEVDTKTIKKEDEKVVTNETNKEPKDQTLPKKKTSNKLVPKNKGNELVTKRESHKYVTKETYYKLIKKGNKLVTEEAGNKLTTEEAGNKLATEEAGNKLVIKEAGNKLVTKEAGNKLVTKEAGNKPIITENILIKKLRSTPLNQGKTNDKVAVESKINIKEFVIKPCAKFETTPIVKKIIWFPPKRKAEQKNEDAKRPKNT